MKKVIAVVLVFVILLSCVCVSAFATSTKISESLAQMMEQTSEGQRITVHVWLHSNVDKEAARRQARKECGYIGGLPLNMTLDEVYAYKAAYNRIVSEQEAAVANSFVGKLGIAEEDIVYLGKHPYVIAKLTNEQINEANTYAEVESLSYVEDVAVEPSTGSNTKISETLQQVMKAMPDDEKIEVHVWLYSNVDKEAARRQARKECGYIGGLPLNMTLDEVYAYKAAYNRIVSEQEATVANSFVEKLGIAEEDIVYAGNHPYVIATLSKEQINEADTYAEVESLSYVDSVAVDPSTDNTKIGETLQQLMKEAPDDEKLEVHIWLLCNIDKAEARRQAMKECGYIGGLPLNMTLDEMYAYKAAYNRIVSEQEAAVANSFVEKLGIVEEDIVYLGKHPYVVAALTKDQINEADTFAEVESIDYIDSPVTEPSDVKSDSVNIYEDKVKEIYPFLYNYSEVYYHSGNNGEVDWVLITGEEGAVFPEPLYQVVGNRVIIQEQQIAPFGFGMAVYSVAQNKVSPIYDGMLSEYDGLEEAFNEYGCGRLIGDLDDDNEISVIDVTFLQRCDIHIREYPAGDLIQPYGEVDGALKYYSDFNRDGERDIMDVTCIQRYLVGMPYPRADKVTNPTATLSFEDINSVYDHPNATVTVTGGTAPYAYCYDIHGSFHGGSNYGDDFGEYVLDTSDSEPGDMDFTTGYIDRATTVIPVESLTYGDTFTLTVTVKDKNGKTSEPVSVRFINAAS